MTAENPEQIDTATIERQNFPHRIFKFLALSLYKYYLEKLNRFEIKAIGKENLQGLEGSAIFAANHVEVRTRWGRGIPIDILALPMKIQEITRNDLFIIGMTNLHFPILSRATVISLMESVYDCVDDLNVIPVNTAGQPFSVVRKSIKILEKGFNLLIFSQGVSLGSFDLSREFRGGTFFIANITKSPIIPVYVETPNSWKVKKGKILIAFGKPIYPDRISGTKEEVQATLADALRESLEQLYSENQP